MRGNRPSFTAVSVAAARGVAGVDPVAAALVGGPLGWVVRALQRGAGPAAANLVTLGLVEHLELRTRALDAVVRDAVAGGTRQVVILGAGLDARAWRMRELADSVVFEIDHPSTQGHKRARIGEHPARSREVRFVAVDFARDRLVDALARAGHDAGAPTVWLWEGVTPYLALDAVRSALSAVAARSAPGSALAVTYATPRRSARAASFMRSALAGFALLGEPIIGLVTQETMHTELAAAGFAVSTDTKPAEWAAHFGRAGAGRPLSFIPERLAVAVRRRGP